MMHTHDLTEWQHDHVFKQDQVKPGERRTLLIVILTVVMMVIEIVAGLRYGSMALLADGLHMASHATALGIALFAYILARQLAADRRFTFGTGKINNLAGFASAVLLLGIALIMLTESASRLINPIVIEFDQALVVAVVGFIVNGVSAWVLVATPHHHPHHSCRLFFCHYRRRTALWTLRVLYVNWLDVHESWQHEKDHVKQKTGN